ncbi:MAG TPA: LysE family translocator [Rudaea sp.]|nr:LysE family translocator [Rudaea sp.]
MIDTPTLATFTLLNMSFALIPGPDVLCILSNSISRGAGAGAKVCLGIAAACLVHVGCAAVGLSALLLAVPVAFLIVKSLGAIYLVWLGCLMILHPAGTDAAVQAGAWQSPFIQGALSNLFNPKIAIFFLAILPQFVHPENGNPGLQALVLGIVSVASGTAVNLVTAFLGGRARAFLLARQKLFHRFQQAAGVVLVGLGLRVVMERAR